MEERFVGGEMSETEFVVIHREMAGREPLVVSLIAEADRASAPTGINQLPFPVVDLDRIPRMRAVLGWDGLAALEWGEASALSVPVYHERFQTGVGSDCGKEVGIALANGKTAGERVSGGRRFDGVVAEADNVIGDIVVHPGEDGAGLVGRRGKRTD